MKKITHIVLLAFMFSAMVSCKKEAEAAEETKTDSIAKTETHRIVSLNGAITEVISALGHEKELVGVDVTSTYPESVKKTAKDLGHPSHGFSVEALMELKPTLILGTEETMTPDLQAKIKASGAKTVIIKQEFSADGAKKLIADVAAALGHTADITPLQNKIDTDREGMTKFEKAPKVLFIYARGANMLMVSGSGTAVDAMIQLAGGTNAVTGYADYKPLTPEALITGNPDVILLFDSGAQSVNGTEGVLKIPGVDKTNAGKNKSIITMEGGLLANFGPRMGEATKALNQLLAKHAK